MNNEKTGGFRWSFWVIGVVTLIWNILGYINFFAKTKLVHFAAMNKIILLTLLLIVAAPVSAEIYKWVDKEGKTHFSDRKPPSQDAKKITVKINTIKTVSYTTSNIDTGNNVVMYATSWCPYCAKARNYFKRKGISFTEYDIEKNKKGKMDYDQLGATGIPVILVGKKRMNGFSESGFESIYKK